MHGPFFELHIKKFIFLVIFYDDLLVFLVYILAFQAVHTNDIQMKELFFKNRNKHIEIFQIVIVSNTLDFITEIRKYF